MTSQPSRRRFLQTTATSGVLASTLPSFLAATLNQLHAESEDRAIPTSSGNDSPILVVLQLAGGNDGLNTVVPFADDHYCRARPKLAVRTEQVLRLNDELGLHPALGGFKALYDAGQLAVLQGVGYPNPNRSHFRSTDIWMTASDSDRFSNRGWLGHYFDHACKGADPTVGIAIGRQSPLAFSAQSPTGIALENPDAYRAAADRLDEEDAMMAPATRRGRKPAIGEGPAGIGDPTSTGGSVEQLTGAASQAGSVIDFLERTAHDARSSSEQIRRVSAKVKNQAEYPAGRLANDLKLVSRLIAGGMSTRVYYVSQGGFDTHQGQAGTHQRLLTELGDATKAFLADLKALGILDRVMLLTFSEFGRRVSENASGGTDHGAAAPLFIAGGRVKPGIVGRHPSLAPADLINGDVAHHTDFRSVYATLLERWLKTSSTPILGRAFPQLEFL
jgi:uncharacterized protein (DUF1501 family)